MKRFAIVFLVLIACGCSLSGAANICDGSRAVCAIITPTTPDKLELLAARELKKYLEEMTTARYEIISEPSAFDHLKFKTYIFVAAKDSSAVMRRLAPASCFAGLKPDGYVLQSASEKGAEYVLISGLTPKSALNGVYGFVEEIIRQVSGRLFVDIDYKLEAPVTALALKPLHQAVNPYCSVNGMELDGLGLDNKSLLSPETREYMSASWKGLVDWARRHKMSFISNWPYGGESMNDLPNIVTLDPKKYPLPVSQYSPDEIRRAAMFRKELLKYASDNGVDPYLMTYVCGWITPSIGKNYPELVGKGAKGEFVTLSGSKPYNWSSPAVHEFMADLAKAVAEQYPEAKGLHLRVWGSESAPDPANASRRGELVQDIINGMVTSASSARPNVNFLLSEYTEFSDPNLTYLAKLKAISPHIILQRKWDGDWAVSNDPKIPAKPAWLNAGDGVPRTVSHSIPNEEAIPFWFPSAKLYQEGIMKYVKPGQETVSGWPINYRDWHTANCDDILNLSAISKLSWDPFTFDHQAFYDDAYYFLFGAKASAQISQASALCAEAMGDFLYDYGGIIDGMDQNNYLSIIALIGRKTGDKYYAGIGHILRKEGDTAALNKIRVRLEPLLTKQSQAVALIYAADVRVSRNREMFDNMRNVFGIWECVLKSRLAAVNLVLGKGDRARQQACLQEFLDADQKMTGLVANLTNVTAKSEHDDTDPLKNKCIHWLKDEQADLQQYVLQQELQVH